MGKLVVILHCTACICLVIGSRYSKDYLLLQEKSYCAVEPVLGGHHEFQHSIGSFVGYVLGYDSITFSTYVTSMLQSTSW